MEGALELDSISWGYFYQLCNKTSLLMETTKTDDSLSILSSKHINIFPKMSSSEMCYILR